MNKLGTISLLVPGIVLVGITVNQFSGEMNKAEERKARIARLQKISLLQYSSLPSRSESERCHTQSSECRKWTELAVKCERNLARIEEGFVEHLTPYCSRAEEYREKVTGIELSSDAKAYVF